MPEENDCLCKNRKEKMDKLMIELDFGKFKCRAELFNTEIAKRFAEHLPYKVDLIQWGGELYGSIGVDLGEEAPIEEIPEGGVAYTKKGNYICVFYGQAPAWAVEYIGDIINNGWTKLLEYDSIDSVVIKRCE